jgi:EAL domain-containing protein (putative c-di-GMP-specific phosphodiesterase class I)
MYKKGTTKIINTIITLGNSLLMDVIAEGVETKHQLEYLLSKNCKSFQGFYFGKPISATALTEMLRTYKRPLFQV